MAMAQPTLASLPASPLLHLMLPSARLSCAQLGAFEAGHPDFHAARLKVMLAQADAPTIIPWDVRKENAKYISKLAHVSARLRLSDEEEVRRR